MTTAPGSPESSLLDWADQPLYQPLPGISGSVRMGEQLSAALFRLEPRAVVPRHTHPNEEFGQVISGALALEAGDEHRDLVAGDAFLIPGDLPHAAVAGPDGCVLLECYAPPRNPFIPPSTGDPA